MVSHTRRTFLKSTAAATLAAVPSRAMTCLARTTNDAAQSTDFQVACYYFPNYHLGDARNEKVKGNRWNEWELVKAARPRFPGHRQPKRPLWGYTDEADPKQMAEKIDAAADHGIDAFIFDWYYYEDGLYLERGLEKGFFGAANNRRLKFALMWADHPWLEIHPWKLDTPQKVLYPGAVSPQAFERMTDYIISSYFKHPSYWLLDGRPYFSVYDLTTLLECFGSAPATRAALDEFRKKTVAAGFPGLHLNSVVWGRPILPKEKTPANAADLVKQLGFDSVTSYVWVHHVALPKFPATPYEYVEQKYFDYCREAEKTFGVPYYPNVTMGWDPSPRANQSDPFVNRLYPFMATISGNTPERFKAALEATKKLLASRPANERLLTINCWNEWTEGSYLEPDTVNGMKYLEAVKEVFGKS